MVPVSRTNAQVAGAANVTMRADLARITNRTRRIAASPFYLGNGRLRGAYDEAARLGTRGAEITAHVHGMRAVLPAMSRGPVRTMTGQASLLCRVNAAAMRTTAV